MLQSKDINKVSELKYGFTSRDLNPVKLQLVISSFEKRDTQFRVCGM
jgi:hypothetical protein